MIDPSDARPPFRQVADALRAAITSGVYGPGDKLPSARELAGEYEITHVTASQAVAALKAEGLVESHVGRGVFVRAPADRRRIDRGRGVLSDERGYYFDAQAKGWVALAPSVLHWGTAPADVATLMGIGADEPTFRRERNMGPPGSTFPLQLATSYLPERIARGTRLEERDTGPTGIYGLMEAAGHVLHWIEVCNARMPTPQERELLRLGDGVPVLRLLRVTRNQHGECLEVNDTRMSAERFEVSYRMDPSRLD
ncbi:GntR family transcriptional regulator [Streptomyces sp. NPDC059816]|uniref:GntR family transcriptional regulator n=1 Tax=Streptomyces sp. NPDC059816 TaxID=3346960 RepID=UPI0036529833